MAQRARIVYDFDGDTENGELVIKEGDIVTINNKDIGDGWWEGTLANGETGLFPESYVEMMGGGGGGAAVEDSLGGGGYNDQQDDDDWDQQQDGYDDEEGEGGEGGERSRMQGSVSSQQSDKFGRAGTVRKNINRFSPFVKTGAEAFVLGKVTVRSRPDDSVRLAIVVTEGEPMWEANPEPYSIEIRDPEKKSKFRGIKSFVAYNVVPSNTSRAVARRYKHYDWLYARLEEKFSFSCFPPLPDKQYYGRYGEDFVEKRRQKLEAWSNRIARHPVLSRSHVVQHFFHCDDEGSTWKAGKRRAEKDELVCAALFTTIQQPQATVDTLQASEKVEAFGAFLRHFKQSLSKMRLKYIDHCNQMSGPFMAEFHKMAGVIGGLAQTFGMEVDPYNSTLTGAIMHTSECYRDIGKLHAEQPRYDMIPCLDVMKEYIGLLLNFPDMVAVHNGTAGKVRDCDKMKEEGRIDYTDATEITTRSEVVSAAVLAEIYHFQHERVVDFRAMMKKFLSEQIRFYSEITRRLEVSLEQYNEASDL